mmetsp:Transcript_42388/g.68748  ORF Transcript_42388/g.68748 Transcript_42388/m.68748 type:complete len:81 (+) Transcript_42388:180-422(+)
MSRQKFVERMHSYVSGFQRRQKTKKNSLASTSIPFVEPVGHNSEAKRCLMAVQASYKSSTWCKLLQSHHAGTPIANNMTR